MLAPMRSNVARAVLVVGVITAIAGGLRLYRLGQPPEKVFDEVYYASDGCWYAGHDFEACGLDADAERSWVHPPLGKLAIAGGVGMFGNRPIGWRVMPAIAGTATVALAGALAFLLTGSWVWAGVGALLTSTEHLLFVQSRVAMLDAFLALLVVTGFTLLAWDRRRNLDPSPAPAAERARMEVPAAVGASHGPAVWLDQPPEDHGPWDEEPSPAPGWVRPLRLLAGAALGAAAAVKWSGALALAAAVILAVAWERTHARRSLAPRPLLRALRTQWAGLLLAFLVVPVLAYTASWIPWFAERDQVSIAGWYDHHRAMARYHLDLSTVNEDGEPIHPYMSEAWSWPILRRPVAYFFDAEGWGEPGGTAREILAIGNPVVFWGGLVVIPYLLLAWWRRRRWEAGAVALAVLVQYLPWLAVSRPLFLFYMTPVAPFLALGLMLAARDLASARPGGRRMLAPVAAVVVGAAVATFVFFWPVLTGTSISTTSWQTRMWLGSWV